MKTSIEEKQITIKFASEQEQELFLDSELFKQLVKWKQTSNDNILKLNEIVRDFPKISQPFIQELPHKDQEKPLDVSPRIDDPVSFPDYTQPNYDKYTTITVTNAGKNDATPKYGSGCDATPRYAKCEVDFPSKYPCDVDSEFLEKMDQKKRKANKSKK